MARQGGARAALRRAAVVLGAFGVVTASAVGLLGYVLNGPKWDARQVPYYVNPANLDVTTSAATAAVRFGADSWARDSDAAFEFVYAGPTTTDVAANDGANTVLFRDASEGSAIAVCYYWSSGGRIIDADIIFYDGAFKFYTGTSGCSGGFYIEDIATHEFGHALGLGHTNVTGATMLPSIPYCEQTRRFLDPDDVAGVEAIYPPDPVVPSPPMLDPIAGALMIGGPNTLTGSGFTAGSVVKLFVATGVGPASYGPYVPQSWTASSLAWSIPANVSMGDGFGSVQIVNNDQGYAESNVVGALLEGDATDNIPTILYLNGQALAPVAPGIPLAHVDTVIAKGSVVTITGTGFNLEPPEWKPDKTGPAVNLFTAAGQIGPLWPEPGASTTQIQVVVPTTTPAGPGNFQVVNSPGATGGNSVFSNAVAAVIGARLTVTGVSVAGTTVTVTGTGFCSLSVINLFNKQGAAVVNLGGFDGATPRIPLTVASDTLFSFQIPAAAVAGQAYVQVLNPPFIPFSSSGSDPKGAFLIP